MGWTLRAALAASLLSMAACGGGGDGIDENGQCRVDGQTAAPAACEKKSIDPPNCSASGVCT